VDLKACHGYLGGELLRPGNTREDSYGGSAENRARMLTESIREAKKLSPDFVVGTRISLYEGIMGGCGAAGAGDVIEELSDILAVLDHIVKSGADFINVSAGIPAIHPQLTRPENKCLFNLYHHFRYAKVVVDRFPGIAVIGSAYSAGKETAVHWAAENIKRGYVHFAGFGRQNLADPGFARKVITGDGDIDRCILCGGCSRLLKNQDRVRCIQYDTEG
jgi:2,4-dienoyl-CoA reductase-like NADH-dependent reductase (Old Yellow Enzyme family)